MASVTYLLSPSPFLFCGFIFASMIAESLPIPNSKCLSFDCGDGLTIHYPFWNQIQNSDSCGYPGLNVSCFDKKPVIQFSDSLYHVKTINYSSNSLVLAYSELEESSCPKTGNLISPSNTTISSLFNYTLGNKVLYFFYNCTLSPPSIPHITCLERDSRRSYVFVEGSIPEFDWHRYCESSQKLPVLDTAVDGDIARSFGNALRDGFRLTWKKPDRLCQDCEASGGFCDNTNGQPRNFSCVCANGRNLSNCNEKQVLMKHETKPYVAIGGLIFGGLVIAGTAFYFVQKRKIASYKPV